MSLRDNLKIAFYGISEIVGMDIDQVEVHGEDATKVTVLLDDGRTVIGTFTKEDKAAFGGVQFSSRKDIPGLMKSKVLAILDGVAEESYGRS